MAVPHGIDRSGAAGGSSTPDAMSSLLDDLVDPGINRIVYWNDTAGALDWLSSSATLSFLGFNAAATGFRLGLNTTQPSNNLLAILQETDTVSGTTTASVQRNVNQDDGAQNPKALRVKTNVNVDTAQTEWAVSGELDNYSDTSSTGNTAVSGVANKFGLAAVFAGHFSASDANTYASAASVTSIIGLEANINALGLDHPTLNAGAGVRLIADIVAKTFSGGINAEIGCGIRITTENNANGGYLRHGIFIQESSGNSNAITTGIRVVTSGAKGLWINGAHTDSNIELQGDANYGIRFLGTYTNAAIRLANDQYVGWRSNNAIKTRFNTSTTRFEFNNAGTLRCEVELDGTPALFFNGTQVLQTQGAAVADASGGGTVDAEARTAINTLLARCRAHGLIAT